MSKNAGQVMKERPIVFAADEVRAILAGTKTQTRLVIRLPRALAGGDLQNARPDRMFGVTPGLHVPMLSEDRSERLRNPWMWPEPSRLWVRETWAPMVVGTHRFLDGLMRPRYLADNDPDDGVVDRQVRGWRPAYHMPRWASRISLDVLTVRVERLQQISEDDARAEGVFEWAAEVATNPTYSAFQLEQLADRCGRGSFRAGFACRWELMHGPGSWRTNPWVWVVRFRLARS